MARQRIVICPESHLFRIGAGARPVGDHVSTPCPVCGRVVSARIVDGRMLSQDALAEAWQHRGDLR